MFLHVSVILLTGGLRAGRTPPDREKPPPGPGRPPPPQTRQTPPGPGRPSPRTRQAPPHPPGKQTPEYGLRAAGTHPTGMHSC